MCAFFFKNTHGSVCSREAESACTKPLLRSRPSQRSRGRRELQWSLSWHAPPGVGAVPRPGSGNEQAAKKQRNVVNITRPAMTTAVGGAGAEGGGYGTRRPSSQRRRCKVGARVTGPATPGHPPGPGQPHLCKNVLHVHRRTHGEEKGIHMYELACPLLLSSL